MTDELALLYATGATSNPRLRLLRQAGPFGFEKTNYDLFPKIRRASPPPRHRNNGNATIVSDGFSCCETNHPEHHAKPMHLAELLAGYSNFKATPRGNYCN